MGSKIISFITARPITFFVLLTMALLTVPIVVIPHCYNMMQEIEQCEEKASYARYDGLTKIQDKPNLSINLNSTTVNLASVLGSNVNGAEHSFVETRNKAYALGSPCKELVNEIHNHLKVAFTQMVLMLVALIIAMFALVILISRAVAKGLHQCDTYRNQMGRTTHDVRGYLACIKGWIELSSNHVGSNSELASNLKKMDTCADDLLALVNSILDMSKIEAGKMQLDDKEFDLAQLVEDIADLHYPNAMKKGVDVIFDTSDSSIMKFSKVIGDQGKLKQIITNLLSNAIKFTSKGHVSIRVKAKKPSFQNSDILSKRPTNFFNKLLGFFSKTKKANNDLKQSSIKSDPNCMEFVFEVEDTGPGIPKDKRHSIFDNFVQVKENSAGHTGTGLGLGIAQSFVRLMGGDIEIVDKANGETGTCFKFNIFLTVQSNASSDHIPRHEMTISGSLVVVLIKNDERRSMVRRFMESLRINLVTLRQGSQLYSALERIKRRANLRGESSLKCILLIIDANAGDFDKEICRSVAHFKKEVSRTCVKVIWLDRSDTRKAHFHGVSEGSLSSNDHVLLQPFHGSRLARVISLLPEFGGQIECCLEKPVARNDIPVNLRSKDEKPPLGGPQQKRDVVGSSEKPLQGKRFLIAEDNILLSKLAVASVTRWGASHTQVCANGKEASEVICKALMNKASEGSSRLPFDYILMDCQMPIVDGLEATRRIREEERKYGVRIPIIALTAHSAEEEGKQIEEAGMDCHLTKPLKIEGLLQAMATLRN